MAKEGNLIMPKQTAQTDAFYASLKLYYDSYKRGERWYDNDRFKIAIQRELPYLGQGAKDGPYLVKQSELVRYFGFAFYDYNTRIGRARITKTGIDFYEAYLKRDEDAQLHILMDSILTISFGRNNSAVKSSDSDIDPPKLFLRAIADLGKISRTEFSNLLYMTHDCNIAYSDAINQLASGFNYDTIVPKEDQNKYSDIKFIPFLESIGIIRSIYSNTYVLSDFTRNNYFYKLKMLSVYNKEPSSPQKLGEKNIQTVAKQMNDVLLTDMNQDEVNSSHPYELNSDSLNLQNNRMPELPNEAAKSNRYKTNPRLGKTAIAKAEFKCENDSNHRTFRAKSGDIYMEAHHLIPMSAQKDFGDKNIDRIENIICLCPNCHAAIHQGDYETRYNMVKKLYEERQDALEKAGISITFEDLFNKYYK